MFDLTLIPFAIFFACCVAQFWFLKQVRDRLIHHPDTFLELERSSTIPHQWIWDFTKGLQHRQLGDEVLNQRVRHFKWLYRVAIAAWLAFALTICTGPTR